MISKHDLLGEIQGHRLKKLYSSKKRLVTLQKKLIIPKLQPPYSKLQLIEFLVPNLLYVLHNLHMISLELYKSVRFCAQVEGNEAWSEIFQIMKL